MFSKKCKQHLSDVNMTRWEHTKFAFKVLVELKKAELALLLHIIVPRCCETYASDKVISLASKMERHDDR
jgi:hypothetical protein|tara:strand:+ start:205 stop:414 length:210 start_codon:yes stop_codon:yes gene_type:complete